MSLYYEIHVTVEFPQAIYDLRGDAAVADWEQFAKNCGWHLGKLLLMKGERSQKDLFFTTRAGTRDQAVAKTRGFIKQLQGADRFKVYRYKIEDTIIDSRIEDTLQLGVV